MRPGLVEEGDRKHYTLGPCLCLDICVWILADNRAEPETGKGGERTVYKPPF